MCHSHALLMFFTNRPRVSHWGALKALGVPGVLLDVAKDTVVYEVFVAM